MPEQQEIEKEAYFVYSVFQSKENGYCVFRYKDAVTGKTFTCTGTNLPDRQRVRYRLRCGISESKKFGKQYTVKSYEASVKAEHGEILDYLCSGVIKGIGKKTAEKIYTAFGDATIDILTSNPEQIFDVKGIPEKRAEAIRIAFQENASVGKLCSFLMPYGISARQAQAVQKRYGKMDVMALIKENPYRLNIFPWGKMALMDAIASDLKIEKTDPRRICAAAEEALKAEMADGHSAVEGKRFAKQFIENCNIPEIHKGNWWQFVYGPMVYDKTEKKWIFPECAPGEWEGPIRSGKVQREQAENGEKGKDLYCLREAYEAECSLAASILALTDKGRLPLPPAADRITTLDESQKEAVKAALTTPISVLTGGPGTGKTTIIKAVADIWETEHPEQKIVMMAPTGRAARRMEEQTGRQASTIHSGLSLHVREDGSFKRYAPPSEDGMIEDAYVIIDEASMLDLWIAEALFARLRNCKVLLVGDTDQLPSVGCGNVLGDIIKSGMVPVSRLTNIHRQSEGSVICENAAKIRTGDHGLVSGDDFKLHPIQTPQGYDARVAMMEVLERSMAAKYMTELARHGEGNVICLCPYKAGPAGTKALNARIQQAVNPPTAERRELRMTSGVIFREGDPVMHLSNITENGYFLSNGDIGKVIEIDGETGDEQLVAKFENGVTKAYSRQEMEDLALAYAITVHKAQGSEYASVITCLTDAHTMMLNRKLIYTAITRGIKNVDLYATPTAIERAVSEAGDKPRTSLLSRMLRRKEPKCRRN